MISSSARLQPAGLTPPPLVDDLALPRRAISGRTRLQIGDRIGGIADRRILHAGSGQQRHCDFRQVVHHQIVDAGAERADRALPDCRPRRRMRRQFAQACQPLGCLTSTEAAVVR